MTGLSTGLIFAIIIAYFAILLLISILTSRKADQNDFFIGGKSSPWYVVAFGMIGATLSGVTFISVPGWVESQQFSYMQMVLGYMVGYGVIAFVLMPMYYRLNLTSIYTYLEQRFGTSSYKTGSGFFLLSRSLGAAFRLFLVGIVLQEFLMASLGIPFAVTIIVTIGLIWVYTFRGGIKTIVWTDTLQTASMIIAVVLTIAFIAGELDLSFSGLVDTISQSEYSKMWFFEGGWGNNKNFFKQFISGAFMAIVMTGLDQDMMQKNLSCKNIGDAQKNMMSFSFVLIFANLLFLSLGVLLFLYSAHLDIETPTRMVGDKAVIATDLLYPVIALKHASPVIGVAFLIGLIAAAYSSADSALTSLTTAFSIDFLGLDKSTQSEKEKRKKRLIVHLGFSVILFIIIMIFHQINNEAVIKSLFDAAGYTYGPLLGLYAFGFFTDRTVQDKWVPIVCIAAPILTYVFNMYSHTLFFGYKFGFEKLLLNGMLTFFGLWFISKKKQ